MPWLESLLMGGLLLAVTGALVPLSRGRSWMLFWGLALALLLLLGTLRRYPEIEMLPIFHPLTAGRTEYVLYGPLAILLLGLPAAQVPRRATRLACAALGLVVSLEYSLGPFLGPALQTPAPVMESKGIFLQGDSYSCGPAASMTALKRLGIEGDFAQLARAAHTSAAIGTPPDLLCEALESLYPVQAGYFSRSRLEDLPAGEALVILQLGLFVDHYMALLEFNDREVWVGDPLAGKTRLTRAEFDERWRHVAVVLTRPQVRR